MCVCVYIYIYCSYVYIYIYCSYVPFFPLIIYIYIYIHTYIYICNKKNIKKRKTKYIKQSNLKKLIVMKLYSYRY